MALNDQGFAIIEIPPAPPELLASYDDCPLDIYMGNQTRYKRFSQYRLSPDGQTGEWKFDKLQHRDYTAYKEFNNVGGGFKRTYLPIEVDFTGYIRMGIREIGLDNAESWQINIHQNRTIATPEKPGLLTPEGVHRDGHEFVMIGVLNRESVSGGETRLWNLDATEPFWTGVLKPGQAVLLDDKAIAHDVTDVQPLNGQPGHRDIFIVAFSRWAHKWYGDEHDEAVFAAAGGSTPAM